MQTLKELIFHKAAEHLLTQGKQSLRDTPIHSTLFGPTRSAYHGVGGTACAVGALISDEHYDPDIEGMPVTSPTVLAAIIEASLGAQIIGHSDVIVRLLLSLLTVHDCTPPEQWSEELQEVAHEYNIEWKRT